MDEATYLQLIALPADQRPAEAAGIAAWIDQWIADDVTRVNVFSSAAAGLRRGARARRPASAPSPCRTAPADTLTAGLSSRSHDFMASFTASCAVRAGHRRRRDRAVLFLTFGSIFLPIKAVLMSLLSITASFGALVWIFQDGNLPALLGFDPSGTIIASTPILMFAILFGLSMDYEVFLLSRIRERYLATGDNTRAVAEGIGITGGIITGAALIMVAVFGAFALSSVVADQVARLQHGAGRADRRDPRPRRARAGLHAGHGLVQLVGAALGPARRRPDRPLRGRAGARRRLTRTGLAVR